MDAPTDWTDGVEALAYQSCDACGERWYFRRDFCPRCGSTQVATRVSNCVGSVYAATVVVRAPSPERRERAPYGICLIDLDEGVRVMTHAEPGIGIGSRVRIGFQRSDRGVLPIAARLTSDEDRT
jgi:uncharacterized protein